VSLTRLIPVSTEIPKTSYLLENLKVMARSHHRKKHKSHLQQFKQTQEVAGTTGSTKVSSMFGIIGAITGGAVGFFASQGSWIWIGLGVVTGALVGYYLGKKLD
jgi:hypothetical protein